MLKTDTAAAAETLSNTGWLADTPPEFRQAVLANCQWRRVAAGNAVSLAGDEDGSPIGIGRGSVTVTTSQGRADTPIVHVLHDGNWFGYMPLFTPDRIISAVARSDVLAAVLPQRRLETMLAEQPIWWRYVGRLPAINLKRALGVIADMIIRDSHERCAAALLQLSEQRFANGKGIDDHDVPLSQQELGAIANLSRTSVSAILRDFETDGLIAMGYRSIVIKNPAGLRAIAEAD